MISISPKVILAKLRDRLGLTRRLPAPEPVAPPIECCETCKNFSVDPNPDAMRIKRAGRHYGKSGICGLKSVTFPSMKAKRWGSDHCCMFDRDDAVTSLTFTPRDWAYGSFAGQSLQKVD